MSFRILDERDILSLNKNYSNAIKGSLKGSVIMADDVSPVEHIVNVKVRGNNLVNVTDVVIEKYTGYHKPIALGFVVEVGKTYTLSLTVESTVEPFIVSIGYGDAVSYYIDGAYSRNLSNGRIEVSFTPTEDLLERGSYVHIRAPRYATETTFSATISDIKLEEGSIATEYTPYIDPSTVLVSRYGKNLLNLTNSSRAGCTISGTGIKANINNVYYCELYANYLKKAVQKMDGKAITFSVGNLVEDCYIAIVIMYTDGTYIQKTSYTKSATLLLDHQGKTVQHVIFRPLCKKEIFTDNTTIINDLMVEFSSIASNFEEYKGSGFTPASDGTISGVTSMFPNMTIITDNENVLLECEYNRDANAVIEKLTNALNALGGTV